MLVESGAAIFATTISDVETAADKCEEMEEGYTQCSQFLYGRLHTFLHVHDEKCFYVKQVFSQPLPVCLWQVCRKSWV